MYTQDRWPVPCKSFGISFIKLNFFKNFRKDLFYSKKETFYNMRLIVAILNCSMSLNYLQSYYSCCPLWIHHLSQSTSLQCWSHMEGWKRLKDAQRCSEMMKMHKKDKLEHARKDLMLGSLTGNVENIALMSWKCVFQRQLVVCFHDPSSLAIDKPPGIQPIRRHLS